MLVVRSPVRISFAGGGTDLPSYYECYGGAVVSVAINKYFYTILRKRTDGLIQIISSDLRVTETWSDFDGLKGRGTDLEIPLAAIQRMGCDIAIDLFLASEIPPGTGLGSSASVCVNVLKTLSTYLQRPMSKHELAETAFSVARVQLGKSVGKQDEYASAFGGLNFIEFCPDDRTNVEPIELESDCVRELQNNLLLFYTGAAHDSWNILQDQDNSTKKHCSGTVEALHAIRELANRLRKALQANDLQKFGELLHEGWTEKKKVSKQISTPRIDQLYEMARANGAIGGKITGAGGGGYMLLYCEKEDQPKVRRAMAEEGIRETVFEFDDLGAHVVVNDPFADADDRGGMRWRFVPNPAMEIRT